MAEIAESEGPEAVSFFNQLDIAVDYNYRQNGYLIEASWGGGRSFAFKFGMSEPTAMEKSSTELDAELTPFMRQNLSLAAQLIHARLDKIFPNAIQRVETEFSQATLTKRFKIIFKNGHVAETPEHESKSDLFIAQCMMLYDLPPL